MASLFSSLFTQMAPVITALGAMGLRLSSLTNPYLLIVTAVGLLAVEFYRLYRLTGSVEGAFDKLGQELTAFATRAWAAASAAITRALNFLEGFTDRARASAEAFDWATFFTSWINRAVSFLRSTGGGMSTFAATVFSELQAVLTGGQAQTQLGRIASNVVHVLMAALGGLGAAASGVDWSSVSDFLARGLSSALFGAFNLLTMLPIGQMMDGLFSLIERGLHLLGSEGASNLISGLTHTLAGQAGRIAEVLLDMLHGAIAFLQGGTLQSSIGPILNVITNAVGSIINALLPLIGGVVREVPTMLHGLVDAIEGFDLGGVLEGLLHNALDLAAAALQGLIPIVVGLVQQIPGLLDHAATVVLEVVAGLPDRLANLFDHAGDRIGPLLAQLLSGLLPAVGELLVRTMGLLWRTLTDYLPRFVSGIGRLFMSLVNGIGTVLIGLVNGIRDWLIGVFPRAAPVITAVFAVVTNTIRGIMGAVGLAGRFITEFIALFLRGFRVAGDGFRMFWDLFMVGVRAIVDAHVAAYHAIVEGVRVAVDWMRGKWEEFSNWFSPYWTQIKTWGEHALAAIVNKAMEVATNIQTGWEVLSGFVSGLWTRIQTTVSESIDRMVGYITHFKDRFMEALNGIWDRVMHLFGNSVHDVVGDDLAQTNDASHRWSQTFQAHANQAFDGATNASSQFGQAAQQVVNLISQRLTGALAASMTGAFQRSFVTILRDLDAFKRLFTASFERFATTLRDRIIEAMEAGRRALQESIHTIESSLDGVARRLESVLAIATTTSAAIQAASPGAGNTVTGQTPLTAVRPLDHTTGLEDVRQAIHDPQWYRQYVALYDAKMNPNRVKKDPP
jgi:phage-related protein